MHNVSWFVVVPPLVVLVTTLLFRHVLLSLCLGILTATLIINQWSLPAALTSAVTSILTELSSTDHLYTFGFLVLLGILIQILYFSGGIQVYTNRLLKTVKTSQAAQTTSLTLSTLLCVDDYVSNLTVGAIMQPVTDHFKLPRAKLAFLLDSMSGPLCLLVPLTSWVAFILGQLQITGIADYYDPFFAYISCIPFLLYPLSIVFTAWVIVIQKLSFGPMAHQERVAQKTGNLFDGKQPLAPATQAATGSGSLADFMLPLALFLASFVLLMAYSGNSSSLFVLLQQADSFWSLFYASLSAVTVSCLWYLFTKPAFLPALPNVVINGFLLMHNSLIILLLAWTFGSLLKNNLHTGDYLASLIPVSSLNFLPLIIAIFSFTITAVTGSVWGTIALMLPISIPLYIQLAGTHAGFGLFALLGALFSGAVAGSHFSPITDAMVMASTAAGCYHLDHLKTHVAYAWPALLGSLLGYLSLALITYPSLLTAAAGSLAISLITTYTVLIYLNSRT